MRQVLSDLRYLTSSDHAHLWTVSNVESLLAFAEKSVGEEGEAIVGALSIFCDLVKNTSISKLQPLNADSSIIKLTQQCSYSTQLTVAGRATQVFFLVHSQFAVLDKTLIENHKSLGENSLLYPEGLYYLIYVLRFKFFVIERIFDTYMKVLKVLYV